MQYDLKFHLLKRFIGYSSLEDSASEIHEICPAEYSDGTAAFHLPNQLSKVVKLHSETNWEKETSFIHPTQLKHFPTMAYQLENVTFTKDAIYKRNFRRKFTSGTSNSEYKFIESSTPLALPSSLSGATYFGHWLRDDVPTYMLSKQYGLPISMAKNGWPDKDYYANVFQQNWQNHFVGHADRVTVFSDYSQNSSKVQRYRQLRDQVRNAHNPKHQNHIAYLKRRHDGIHSRIINNERTLISELRNRDVKIIDMTTNDIHTTISELLNAKLVITTEGSQVNHVLYTLRDDGGILLMVPPRIFTNIHKGWTDALGMDYGFVVGDDVDDKSFNINISELLHTLDMML